ncbi:MAG: zinc ribbon domain-containing protein [Gammaproteobacteria bacterium]
MGFQTCTGCQAKIPIDSNFCPSCSAVVEAAEKPAGRDTSKPYEYKPDKSKKSGFTPSASDLVAILFFAFLAGFTIWGIYVNNFVFKDGASPAPPTAAQVAAQRRTDQIESQFSPFNGSHRNLVNIVKTSMNDPDSFEHVETGYVDAGDNIRIQMVYRGRNAFGGTVTERITVLANLNGDILEIIGQ